MKEKVDTNTGRTRRTRDDIMNRIVKAATTEFKQLGYSNSTTAVIARNAEVSETQLFRYFGSKSQLFQTTIFDPLAKQLAEFVKDYLPSDPGTSFLIELQKFINSNIDMLTSLVVVQTYGRDEAQGVAEVDSLKTYFEHGEAAIWKRVVGHPNVHPALMVRISFVAILASIMFRDWIFPPGMADVDEITWAINQFTLYGVEAINPRGMPDHNPSSPA